jgi:hypothetical protein
MSLVFFEKLSNPMSNVNVVVSFQFLFLASIPERVDTGLSWAQEQGGTLPKPEGLDRIITVLTDRLDENLKEMRRELEELRAISNR